MMVTLAKSIMYALAAPVLIAVDAINDTLLKARRTLVAVENDLNRLRSAMTGAQRTLSRAQGKLSHWRRQMNYANGQWHHHRRVARMRCGVYSQDCNCWDCGHHHLHCWSTGSGWGRRHHCRWEWHSRHCCWKCLVERPRGCIGDKIRAVANEIYWYAKKLAWTVLYHAANIILSAARLVVRLALVVVNAVIKIIQFAKSLIDLIYDGFKVILTPLVGICNLLKVGRCRLNRCNPC